MQAVQRFCKGRVVIHSAVDQTNGRICCPAKKFLSSPAKPSETMLFSVLLATLALSSPGRVAADEVDLDALVKKAVFPPPTPVRAPNSPLPAGHKMPLGNQRASDGPVVEYTEVSAFCRNDVSPERVADRSFSLCTTGAAPAGVLRQTRQAEHSASVPRPEERRAGQVVVDGRVPTREVRRPTRARRVQAREPIGVVVAADHVRLSQPLQDGEHVRRDRASGGHASRSQGKAKGDFTTGGSELIFVDRLQIRPAYQQ